MLVTQFTLFIYFTICVFFVIVLNQVKEKQRNIIFAGLTILSILMVTFRGELGADTATYISFVRHIEWWNTKRYLLIFEPFFIYFVLLAKTLVNDHIFVFFLAASLSIILKSYSIAKYSPYQLLSFIIFLSSYFLSLEFNQMRQGISVGFFVFSIEFLFKKEYIKYYLILLTGCFFHSSLLLCLLVPFVPRTSNYKIIILSVLTCFIFVFLSLPLSSIIKFISPFAPSMVGDKLLYYILSEYAIKVGFSVVQLWYIIIVLLGCYYIRFVNSTKYEFYFNLFVVGVCLNFIFNSVSVLLRLSYPLLLLEIFIPPFIIKNSKNKVLLTILFVIFYTFRFINLLKGFK
ncbi:EpsG family protein [Halosquirtibacter xylanolyticus]|uniref:EpsG family protein n=1 Tax=Halosquirtibacter xylanolyticus TaxID=3374599 RepID=UPI003747F19C|nr:EpsG family protein [Prolixibacteraceae bacterium]